MKYTSEEYRSMAKGHFHSREESFDRCDTDGFLSQWADQQMAHRYLRLADLADSDWEGQVLAVYDLDGNFVTWDMHQGNYGAYYFIEGEEGKARFFNPSNAQNEVTRIKNNAKKGYIEAGAFVKFDVNSRTETPYPVEYIKPAEGLSEALEVLSK